MVSSSEKYFFQLKPRTADRPYCSATASTESAAASTEVLIVIVDDTNPGALASITIGVPTSCWLCCPWTSTNDSNSTEAGDNAALDLDVTITAPRTRPW